LFVASRIIPCLEAAGFTHRPSPLCGSITGAGAAPATGAAGPRLQRGTLLGTEEGTGCEGLSWGWCRCRWGLLCCRWALPPPATPVQLCQRPAGPRLQRSRASASLTA